MEDWFRSNGITLDPNLAITTSSTQHRSISSSSTCPIIPPDTSIASIPTSALLSTKNSSFPSHLLPPTTDELLVLASCVLFEQRLGAESKWYGYLQSLPAAVDIGLLWEESSQEREWAKGTEIEGELLRLGVTPASLTDFYSTHVLPLLPSASSPNNFHHAYSLVSSRAFFTDQYHKLSLVPLADLFDHDDSLNQVQLAVDEWVCPICGKIWECEHDGDLESVSVEQQSRVLLKSRGGTQEKEEDKTVEMVTSRPILPGTLVFNTYGSKSNADLLVSYGFVLEENQNDRISFSFEDVFKSSWKGMTVSNGEDPNMMIKEEGETEERLDLPEVKIVWKEILDEWTKEEEKGGMNRTVVEDNEDETDELLEPFISKVWKEKTLLGDHWYPSPLYISPDAQLSFPLFILLFILVIPNLNSSALRSQLSPTTIEPLYVEHELRQKISPFVLKLLATRRSKTMIPTATAEKIFDMAQDEENHHLKIVKTLLATERVVIQCVEDKWAPQCVDDEDEMDEE